MKIEKIYKLAIWVNVGSLAIGGLVTLIMFFTPWKIYNFSFFFGVLLGLVCFSILLQNGKSLMRQARALKDGEKPVNHYGLYLLLKLLVIVAVLGIFAYFQFYAKKEGFNLVALAAGYASSRLVVIVASLILREKVLY